jgi:hypothetical protein
MPDFTKREGELGLPPVPPSSVYNPLSPPANPSRTFVSSPPPPPSPLPVYPGRRWPVWALAMGLFLAIVIPGITIVLVLGVARGSNTQTNAPAVPPAALVNPSLTTSYQAQAKQVVTGKLGDSITAKGYVVTAGKVERSQDFSGSGIGAAASGDELVAVEITVTNQGATENGGFPLVSSPLYCFLKDNQGHSSNVVLVGKEPQFNSDRNLLPGDTVSGWVTFEAKVGAQGLVFSYAPPGAGLIFQFPFA